jgi:hypothetical protein
MSALKGAVNLGGKALNSNLGQQITGALVNGQPQQPAGPVPQPSAQMQPLGQNTQIAGQAPNPYAGLGQPQQGSLYQNYLNRPNGQWGGFNPYGGY